MLPFVLVLFVATSAIAAPSVSVSQYNINEIAPVRDNGRAVSSYLTDRSYEYTIDEGDSNIYVLTIKQIMNDMANQADSLSQSIAVGSTIAVIGELGPGSPGDACESAALVNAYASRSGVGSALSNWANRMNNNMDMIVQIVNDPKRVRYSTGPRGNCAGGGRNYQFEAAWDSILDSANVYQIGLLNEEYCAAKRLYSASNVRSNNVGAAVTAVATGPANAALQQALPALANFLRAVASGGNPAGLVGQAKQALASAVANVQASGAY